MHIFYPVLQSAWELLSPALLAGGALGAAFIICEAVASAFDR